MPEKAVRNQASITWPAAAVRRNRPPQSRRVRLRPMAVTVIAMVVGGIDMARMVTPRLKPVDPDDVSTRTDALVFREAPDGATAHRSSEPSDHNRARRRHDGRCENGILNQSKRGKRVANDPWKECPRSSCRALTWGKIGAGDGNRTRVASLEDWGSTIELRPRGAGRAWAVLVRHP